MKKFLSFIMFVSVIFCFCACGSGTENPPKENPNENPSEEIDAYAFACTHLEETSMGSTVYSQTQIDEFEGRFTKMNLQGGFLKVNHFRSTLEYAYVIEFENPQDAQTFFDRISTANYNVKKINSVVVYGKSDSIDTLE